MEVFLYVCLCKFIAPPLQALVRHYCMSPGGYARCGYVTDVPTLPKEIMNFTDEISDILTVIFIEDVFTSVSFKIVISRYHLFLHFFNYCVKGRQLYL